MNWNIDARKYSIARHIRGKHFFYRTNCKIDNNNIHSFTHFNLYIEIVLIFYQKYLRGAGSEYQEELITKESEDLGLLVELDQSLFQRRTEDFYSDQGIKN